MILPSLKKYVNYQSLKLYASDDSFDDIMQEPIFVCILYLFFISFLLIFYINFTYFQDENYQYKRNQFKQLIGHALQHIARCQLQVYFAMIYGLISLDDIINNNQPPSPNDKYLKLKFSLKWSSGTMVIEYVPRILAPAGCIFFWINQLKMSDDKFLKSFAKLGNILYAFY